MVHIYSMIGVYAFNGEQTNIVQGRACPTCPNAANRCIWSTHAEKTFLVRRMRKRAWKNEVPMHVYSIIGMYVFKRHQTKVKQGRPCPTCLKAAKWWLWSTPAENTCFVRRVLKRAWKTQYTLYYACMSITGIKRNLCKGVRAQHVPMLQIGEIDRLMRKKHVLFGACGNAHEKTRYTCIYTV